VFALVADPRCGSVNYGHFTAMQIRGGKVRGLELHLARLATATRELFGTELDGNRVRGHIRHALGRLVDASVFVTVFWPDAEDQPSVMVTVRPPVDVPTAPQRLQSVTYQRESPAHQARRQLRADLLRTARRTRRL
jgi:branched-subunit amino acid aminotransferase/4-amino-4-deoxychorismate lyase